MIGSCDNGVRIWKHTEANGWTEELLKGQGHTGSFIFYFYLFYSILFAEHSFNLYSIDSVRTK